ncbi:TetR family transcriptional regulator [Gordonia sp. X0973]|uniref:TetR/AcrR family transcriptional regulator n=1 Tax=Gordonia sp. X0973 TaxID=2742602 RepID=UPI000F53E17A|nr:TetR family transcriptional regulator [Gordonia sp. X0973]QKT06395.1 TetR family transcriptional regulator [Gordonia sp. X0973]
MARMTVEQRREALIDAAYRVIADHGVEGATTRKICAQAQMPLASFHYAFESRMALLAAVIDQAVPRDLTSLVDEVREPADGLRGLAGVEREMSESLHNLYELMLVDPGRLQATVSLAIYAHNHPELQAVGRQMWDRLYALAANTLRSVAEMNGTRWTIDAEELGTLMIASTNAITMTWLTTADKTITRRVVDGTVRWMLSYAAEDDLAKRP